MAEWRMEGRPQWKWKIKALETEMEGREKRQRVSLGFSPTYYFFQKFESLKWVLAGRCGWDGDCIFVSVTEFPLLIWRCLTSMSSTGSLFLFNVTLKRRFRTSRHAAYNYHSAWRLNYTSGGDENPAAVCLWVQGVCVCVLVRGGVMENGQDGSLDTNTHTKISINHVNGGKLVMISLKHLYKL